MTLDQLATTVAQLHPGTDRDQVLDLWDQVNDLARRVRELKADAELRLIEWLDANGDLEIGDGRRLYVGTVRTHRPRSNPEALTAILEATGGDVGALAGALASSPWKAGAVRALLGDRFGDVFETKTQQDLKTGKAKRTVRVADERFTRPEPAT